MVCCSICLTESENEEQNIKCNKNECKYEVCSECMEQFVNFSLKENVSPNCPGCKNEYFKSNLASCSNDTLQKYDLFLFKKLSGEIKENSFDKKKFIDQIRKDKVKFIESKFPKCISLVINQALCNKMKKIDNKNKNFIKKQQNEETKNIPCPDPICSGIVLGENCQKCSVKICFKCEAPKKINHICLKEDIASVELLSSLVKCPNCKLPVIKSWGCNYITCAVCKTNFDYTTGNRSISGNHQDTTIILNKSDKKLYIMFREKYSNSICNMLATVDNFEPKEFSFNNVLSTLLKCKKLSESKDKQRVMQILSYRYEKFNKNKAKFSKHLKIKKSIIEKESTENLSEEFLSKVIKICEKEFL